MALQPIDLQTMYSQMANVAQRVAGESQGATLAQSLQTQTTVNQNLQKSQAVQKTAENQTGTSRVKADSSGTSREEGGKKGSGKKQEEEVFVKNEYEIRDPTLGNHINITR